MGTACYFFFSNYASNPWGHSLQSTLTAFHSGLYQQDYSSPDYCDSSLAGFPASEPCPPLVYSSLGKPGVLWVCMSPHNPPLLSVLQSFLISRRVKAKPWNVLEGPAPPLSFVRCDLLLPCPLLPATVALLFLKHSRHTGTSPMLGDAALSFLRLCTNVPFWGRLALMITVLKTEPTPQPLRPQPHHLSFLELLPSDFLITMRWCVLYIWYVVYHLMSAIGFWTCSQLHYKVHEGKEFCWSWGTVHRFSKCLLHSVHSINICWMSKWHFFFLAEEKL